VNAEQSGSIHDQVLAKETGLETMLVIDSAPRAMFQDRFFDAGQTAEILSRTNPEKGTFIEACYRGHQQKDHIRFSANGQAFGLDTAIDKSILVAGDQVRFRIRITNLSDRALKGVYASEFNVSLLSGHSPDRYYEENGRNNGHWMDAVLNDRVLESLAIVNEWDGFRITFYYKEPAACWRYPVFTVNMSESGFEKVYQGSAILPNWSPRVKTEGNKNNRILSSVGIMGNDAPIRIAYFSAEIGISASLPTYSGGLGVLAGDHIKAAADAELPMCAVTLLYKEGYFQQRLDTRGFQTETYTRFDPEPLLVREKPLFTLRLRERNVWVQAYRYDYTGITGHTIPLYFLDTDLDENFDDDRIITMRLYSGDKNHRILQEAVLGFGGMKLLNALGYSGIETFHMNEGHCSFLTLDLYERFNHDRKHVQSRCHFTTHTPVPAGHDHFNLDRCAKLLYGLLPMDLGLPSMVQNSRMHMTELGLYFSRSANGVSRLHGEVAQQQFPEFKIDYITNGVYHPYWVGRSLRELFDLRLPGWREDPEKLLGVDSIPAEELMKAHESLQDFLLGYANSQTQRALSPDLLTIGFARRAAGYKRARLLFRDPDRLARIGQGQVQIIFAGKAHPKDALGKQIIQDIVAMSNRFFGRIKIVFLENYNMWLGRLITSGVDVWLNTPLRPNEASGTSGMKAALNGIPNLSIVDGWWAEGCRHGINGWGIGSPDHPDDDSDADHLYTLLEKDVIPTFYEQPETWVSLMRESIKTGVEFTAHRMVRDYIAQVYSRK